MHIRTRVLRVWRLCLQLRIVSCTKHPPTKGFRFSPGKLRPSTNTGALPLTSSNPGDFPLSSCKPSPAPSDSPAPPHPSNFPLYPHFRPPRTCQTSRWIFSPARNEHQPLSILALHRSETCSTLTCPYSPLTPPPSSSSLVCGSSAQRLYRLA